jgi:hypothetical protein
MVIETVLVKSSQPLKYIHKGSTQPVMRTGHKSTKARPSFKVITPTVPFIRAAIKCLHSLSQRTIAIIAAAIRSAETAACNVSIILASETQLSTYPIRVF